MLTLHETVEACFFFKINFIFLDRSKFFRNFLFCIGIFSVFRLFQYDLKNFDFLSLNLLFNNFKFDRCGIIIHSNLPVFYWCDIYVRCICEGLKILEKF